jgi:hypothetical protein
MGLRYPAAYGEVIHHASKRSHAVIPVGGFRFDLTVAEGASANLFDGKVCDENLIAWQA